MNSSTSTPPPSSSTAAINGDKLSGQLIIKAQLGDDIRKMMIHNEDLTLNELVLMMERIFVGKISNSDEITIKYLDDDGDRITLLNDSDLTVALHFHKHLRLFVFVNGQEQINSNNSTENLDKQGSLIDAKTFRTELQQIRNSVQTILDRLQLPSSHQEKEAIPTVTPSSAVVSSTTRDFDPYKNVSHPQQAPPQQQQQQRSSTPDSIRSKSSTSHQIANNEQKTFQSAPTGHSQSIESSDAHVAQQNYTFQQAQMPTPHFAQSPFATAPPNDQHAKPNTFGPPPTSFPGMPQLPTNTAASRFPTAFPTNSTLPNAGAPPQFNSAPTPPPPTAGQPSAFIGQQPAPPQQSGFYGQQQALFQQRPPMPGYNPGNPNNAFAQQAQPPAMPPPSSSSPATINPSFIQPPPMAAQQPYGAYAPQNTYYNAAQQYTKTS